MISKPSSFMDSFLGFCSPTNSLQLRMSDSQSIRGLAQRLLVLEGCNLNISVSICLLYHEDKWTCKFDMNRDGRNIKENYHTLGDFFS